VEGKGYYVASLHERGRRVTGGGLFARGNGTWIIDETGLSFRRALTREPIRIARDRIRSVSLSQSSWWGGKWFSGARVVEIVWIGDDGSVRTSGFVFSGKPAENADAAAALAPDTERPA
jgi:hypothetical protein